MRGAQYCTKEELAIVHADVKLRANYPLRRVDVLAAILGCSVMFGGIVWQLSRGIT